MLQQGIPKCAAPEKVKEKAQASALSAARRCGDEGCVPSYGEMLYPMKVPTGARGVNSSAGGTLERWNAVGWIDVVYVEDGWRVRIAVVRTPRA